MRKIFETFSEYYNNTGIINEGYTHYLTQNKAFSTSEWNKIIRKTRDIVDAAKKDGIIISDGVGNEPIIDETEIMINGDPATGNDHESLWITRWHNKKVSFCKTNRKPYDAVVVSILSAIEDIAPGKLTLSSDGGNNVFDAPLYELEAQILEELDAISEDSVDEMSDLEINMLYEETEEFADDDDIAAEYIDAVEDEDEDEEDEEDEEEEIEEALKKKKIIKNGKKIIKITTDKPGFKVVDGKEVKMSPQEIKNRKKGAKARAKSMAKMSSGDKAKIAKARAKTKAKNDKLR